MFRSLFSLILFILCGAGCTAPMLSVGSPSVTIEVFRKDATSGGLRPASDTEVLAAQEEAILEIRVDRPAYVAAVLFSAAGTSLALNKNPGNSPLSAQQSLRVTIPRAAPPGVKESELPVVIAASIAPLSPALQQLLRLPCNNAGGRGDPEPEKEGTDRSGSGGTKGDSGSSSGSSGGDTGKPPTRESRGGSAIAAPCVTPAGLGSSTTIQTLQLRSE